MPFKSIAQKDKFKELLKDGKITQKVYDEFDAASKGLKLPKRVRDKKDGKPKGTFKHSKGKGKHSFR